MLADNVIAYQVTAMAEEFPDEHFPVRPAYRKAMYHRLMLIVDELNFKMQELLKESPDETDAVLQRELLALQEGYEQAFIRAVRKEDECESAAE